MSFGIAYKDSHISNIYIANFKIWYFTDSKSCISTKHYNQFHSNVISIKKLPYIFNSNFVFYLIISIYDVGKLSSGVDGIEYSFSKIPYSTKISVDRSWLIAFLDHMSYVVLTVRQSDFIHIFLACKVNKLNNCRFVVIPGL